MPDKFGALEIPAQIPAAGETLTDPTLDVIGAFCQAILNADAGDAWNAIAPGTPLVRAIQTNNPKDGTFNAKDLPALFLWRQRGKLEAIADDWLCDNGLIGVLWVGTPEIQVKRAQRQSIFNALNKTMSAALWNGRHAAWVDPSDTDPTAASRGSVLLRKAGLSSLWMSQEFTETPLTIEMDGSEPKKYVGYTMVLATTELQSFDASVHGAAPTSAQVDLDEDGLIVDESIDGN